MLSDIRQHSDDTEDNQFYLLSGDYLKVIDSDRFDCLEETGLMDGVCLTSVICRSNSKTCDSSAVTCPKRTHSYHYLLRRFWFFPHPPKLFLFLRGQGH